MTVLLWGVPSEPPMAMVARRLAALGADVLAVRPDGIGQQVDITIGARWSGPGPVGDRRATLVGTIRAGGRSVELASITGAYLRPVEPELVPELKGQAETAPGLAHARRVQEMLTGFTEAAPQINGCRIANRLSAMASNGSKPYQAQVIARHGFSCPDTLISTDPQEVLDFAARHGQVVYKSCSGIRSIVTAFDPVADRERLQRLRWCPVQFQERVDGPDVRVHVVGGDVFAAIVDSTAVDYRYARTQVGEDARLLAYQLDDDIASRCVALAAALDLPFAGIDLKLAADQRVICFEVNPSPGFSWYESATELPISRAVARWLLAASS
jgi:glutathione synthase/RimK-type ligase-like ATP-grasp enzyme